jgi:cobalt-zinc-cadmium efflux system membrane fusion protein
MKSIFLVSIFTASLLVGCTSTTEEKTEKETVNLLSVNLNAEQVKNAEIKEGLPTKELIGLTITANGTIEVPPQNKTVISAQFGGFVKSLNVLDGMTVSKGQTLFTIEHPELIQLQQDYLEVIGNMEYLTAELDRQKSLVQQEAGSLKAMQLAKSQLSIAHAKKTGLKAKLEMAGVSLNQLNAGNLQRTIAVTAPFNGVVTKVDVNVGAYADPTEHLLEIIDLKHAHAEVIAFEKDVKHLKIGQSVQLSFSNDNETINAKIFLIGKEIGKDRTVKVHCHLDAENSDIAPGSYFKASIYTEAVKRYCIPADAVVEMNGKNVVFFGKKGKKGLTTYTFEDVTVLATENGKAAIVFKNKERSYTDQLVVHGAYDIMSAFLIKSEE